MKTLKSILLGTFIAVGGIALAMNAKTQESICSERSHDGYTYPQGQTPPATSNPSNLPAGMLYAGKYEEAGGFSCTTNDERTCHWAYNTATSTWVPCEGDYVDLP